MLQEILTYIILAVTVAAVLYSLFFKKSGGCGCSRGTSAGKGGASSRGASCSSCASCGSCPLCSTGQAHIAPGADGAHCTSGKQPRK